MRNYSILAINLKDRLACDDTGDLLPIVTMFDLDGDATDDPELALEGVAGPDRDDKWYRFTVSGYGGRKPH